MTFDLNAEIRKALATWPEPDPHVIARRLVAKIPEDHVRDAFTDCLADRVRIVNTRGRMVPTPSEMGAAPQSGRSRWARLAPVLRQRYYVDGEWKLLADCDANDLDVIAEGYARRAAEQAALEARFRELAARLRAAGVATVADLGADVELAA